MHSRHDEIFVIHFSISNSTSSSLSWYLRYLTDPFTHNLITICSFADTCLVDLFILIWTSDTLRLLWMQRLRYRVFFVRNSFFFSHDQWYPCDKLDSFVIVCDSQERMCDRLVQTLDLSIIRCHFSQTYGFFQYVLNFIILSCRREICHHGSSLLLIFLWITVSLSLLCVFVSQCG